MQNHATLDLTAEFPILAHLHFFNHAGVSPISARAASALKQFADHASTRSYVDSGWYQRPARVKQLAARLFNAAGPQEIAIIPNTATGLNLVARGLDWQPGDAVVITNVEYPANRYPWEDLKRLGVDLIEVPQQPDGRIDVEDVVEAITDRTRIVAVSHVQYASGCRLDLKPISDMVHQAGGYLCVDAIQSAGVIPIDVQAMGIDFLAAGSQKWLMGIEGCGLFYCREDLAPLLHPAIVGCMNMINAFDFGNYEFVFQSDARRFEPSSHSVPGLIALETSLELFLEVGIDQVWASVDALTTRLCERLAEKNYRVFSPREPHERSGIVTFDPPFPDTRLTPAPAQIVADLEKQGIIIVMREGRLRASPHFYNTMEQIDLLVDALP